MKSFLTIMLSFFVIILQAQDYKIEGSEVKIAKPVLFETGSAKLKPESIAALEIIVKYLTEKSYITQLRIEGHTDNNCAPGNNQGISEKRALVVCKKLIEMGVDCKRLIAVGFGGTKPIADIRSPVNNSENCRISFVNVSLRGRAIGGLPIDGGGQNAGEPCN